ncbi:MAG: hypothetical protein U1F36_10815 [Planctomycetota bacterium]
MTTPLRSPIRFAAFLLACVAILSGCGGGGGSSSTSGGSGLSTTLFVDGAAGLDADISGRLAQVGLESVGGGVTQNLIASEQTCALAQVDGSGTLIQLRGIPRGAYAALLLRFVDGSLEAQLADGRRLPLEARAAQMRVVFTTPWLVDGSAAPIALRRTAPATMTTLSGTVVVDGPVDIAPIDVIPIRFGHLRVTAVDRTAQTAQGLLVSMDLRPVHLSFTNDALLLRDPSSTELSIADFVDGLAVGATLVVDGLLDVDDNLVANAALDLGVFEPHGRGQKGELRGRIVEILLGREAFRLAITRVEKGEGLLPSPVPQELVVDASSARVKWIPRRGRELRQLDFAALQAGMIVEIEWHGAVAAELPADKVDIRAQGTCYERQFEGEVGAVSLAPPRVTLHLPAPIVIDGRQLQDLELQIGEDVPIVRSNGTSLRAVRLADVQVGETARVLADPRGRGMLRASLVVLEWR